MFLLLPHFRLHQAVNITKYCALGSPQNQVRPHLFHLWLGVQPLLDLLNIIGVLVPHLIDADIQEFKSVVLVFQLRVRFGLHQVAQF